SKNRRKSHATKRKPRMDADTKAWAGRSWPDFLQSESVGEAPMRERPQGGLRQGLGRQRFPRRFAFGNFLPPLFQMRVRVGSALGFRSGKIEVRANRDERPCAHPVPCDAIRC